MLRFSHGRVENLHNGLQEHLKGVPLDEALSRVKKQTGNTPEIDDEDEDKIETTWYKEDEDDNFWITHAPSNTVS